MDKRKLISEIEIYLKEELSRAESAERSAEVERLLTMYRFLPIRVYDSKEDVVVPSALIELKLDQMTAHYFIVPSGGGLITQVEGRPVQVITPQSPLGQALLGKRVGDRVEVELRGTIRVYEILNLC